MCDEHFFTTRRQFLSGSLTLLSGAATLPTFLGSTARALAGDEPPAAKRRDDSARILVVVQLAGGNDGLNTVIPVGMDPYYQYRRRLAIQAKDALALQNGFALHPAATGLKALYDEGQMAIVHGVGYPNPNRSHFMSMDVWHTADPNLRAHSGWLGRYFDSQCRGADPAPEPTQGIALMQETPLALYGEKFSPLAFSDTGELQWRGPHGDERAADVWAKLNNRGGEYSDVGSEIGQFLQRAALQAQVGAQQITDAAGGGFRARRRGRGGGAGPLDQQLQMVARMIAADLPTRVYYVSLGGFDTHSGQAPAHQRLLQQFGNAMKSFLDQLREDQLLERVLVVTFSEFGRRVQENASGGTDHGEAAPVFLFGAGVRPGLHGDHPDLRQLHRGDLAHTTDFRRIYATVLRDWLKTPYEKIVGPGFHPLRLIST